MLYGRHLTALSRLGRCGRTGTFHRAWDGGGCWGPRGSEKLRLRDDNLWRRCVNRRPAVVEAEVFRGPARVWAWQQICLRSAWLSPLVPFYLKHRFRSRHFVLGWFSARLRGKGDPDLCEADLF